MPKPSGGTNTVVQQSQPPQQFLNAYQNLVNTAGNVTSQTPQAYGGPLVAGFTPQQQQGFQTTANAQGLAQPYINSAATEFGSANTPFYNTVGSYLSPYTSAVTAPLQALYGQQNAQQQQQVAGNATAAGAYGGDREAVAQALTAQQQNLSEAPTLANVLQGGYQTGLGAAEQQGWLGEQEAFGLGNLGPTAENAALTGANANISAGGLQQQLAQEQMNIPYEEFQQAQAAPYQNLNELASIVEGAGSLSGGTSSSTYPGPSLISQLGGLGIGGLGLYGLANQTGLLNLFGPAADTGAGAAAADVLGGDALGTGFGGGFGGFVADAAFGKAGGRVGLQAGGAPAASGLAAPVMNSGGFTLPPVPNINLDYIAPAGPEVKGAGPPKAPSVGNPSSQDMSPLQMLQGLSAAEKLNKPDAGLGSAAGGRVGLQGGGNASLLMGQMGAQGPNTQGFIQRFMQMPLDQLQAYASQMPPSTPMGAIVNRVLQQRRMSPQGSAPQVSGPGGVPIGSGLAATPGVAPQQGGMAEGGLAHPIAETPDMDPHPVVDHTGPTVVVRYPSEGKTLDLGLPSSPQMAAAARGHRAAGGAGAPAPLAPSPLTGTGGASPFMSTTPTGSGLAVPQVSMSLFADPTGTIGTTPIQPGGGLGNWFNPLPQYQPPGATVGAKGTPTAGQYTLPSTPLYSPGMANFQGLNLLAAPGSSAAPGTAATTASTAVDPSLFGQGNPGAAEGGRIGLQEGGGLDPGDTPPSDATFTDPLSGSPMTPLTGIPPTSLGIGQALKDLYVTAPQRDETPHVLPDPAGSQDLSLKGMGVAAPTEDAGLGQPKPISTASQGLGAPFTAEPQEGLGQPVGEPAKPAAMLTPDRAPPGVKFNSRGEPYSAEPTGGVPVGTPGAGAPITTAQAKTANADALARDESHLPTMPSSYVFGTGRVAPLGAGGAQNTGPVPSGMGAAPPSAVQPLASGKPSAVSRDDVVNFWVNNGAPRQVAEGIADSVERESRYDPNAWNPNDKGSPSGGLYQHHDTRLAGLQAFAAGQKGDWTDPNIQNQYAHHEVTGGDPIATAHWNEILAAPDRATAQTLWDKYFERGAVAGPAAAPAAPTGGTAGAPVTQGQVVDAAQHILARTPPEHRSAMAQWMDSPYFPLFLMGAGMLASRSPFPGVALGEGMKLAGQGMETMRGQQNKEELAQAHSQYLNDLAAVRQSGSENLAQYRDARIAQAATNQQQAMEIKTAQIEKDLAVFAARSDAAKSSQAERIAAQRQHDELEGQLRAAQAQLQQPSIVPTQDDAGNPVTAIIPRGAAGDRSKWTMVPTGAKPAGGLSQNEYLSEVQKRATGAYPNDPMAMQKAQRDLAAIGVHAPNEGAQRPTASATPPQGAATPTLPPAAASQLKEGQITKFGNGQEWTLRGGQPVMLPASP